MSKPLPLLKNLIVELGVSQNEFARSVDLGDGQSLSPSSLSLLINKGQTLKKVGKPVLHARLTAALRDAGAGDSEIADALRPLASAKARNKQAENTTRNAPPSDCPYVELENLMLLQRQTLTPEARKHFQLFRDPFLEELTSSDDVFVTSDIRYVRETMYQTARTGGMLAVVGESGAGKSTLRRDLLDRLNREKSSVIVIEPYVLGMEESDTRGKTLKASHIAHAILRAVAPLERPKANADDRFRQVHSALRDSSRAGHVHVLMIEEAHGIPLTTLKHLKRFFELEDGFRKLLSVILIGQPELKTKLTANSFEVREVVQRCQLVELLPLNTDLRGYLEFKFERVGKPLAQVVDSTAIDALRDRLQVKTGRRGTVHEYVSLLYPLAVNNVLTAAINLAAALGKRSVDGDVVREV